LEIQTPEIAGSLSDMEVGGLARRLPTRYPFVLVDRITHFDPNTGLKALKTVTGAEEFFEGHFPGAPVMPGVLLMESLAQAAGIWLLQSTDPTRSEVLVVGIDNAKFRKPVTPGDRLDLEISLIHRRGDLFRIRGEIKVGEQRVAEGRILLSVSHLRPPEVHETAIVAEGATLAAGVKVGPYAVIGADVHLGPRTIVEAHAVIDGDTHLGEANHVFPFASIGLAPQDLKFGGEKTCVRIGDRNVFREGVTVHRGTRGGGGLTEIGSDNLFMAQAHVAHDCRVGSHTIFANAATLAGHVEVADYATVGAFSAVHQFCRVGTYAFMGGFTVATMDVLPYSKTAGNRPACLFGPNTLGLKRRGFPPETLAALRRAYRLLMQSGLPAGEALQRIETEAGVGDLKEVKILVDFMRTAKRGVIVKRRKRVADHDE
jgi:UDP-N-acetylglucosamine acyltransferase